MPTSAVLSISIDAPAGLSRPAASPETLESVLVELADRFNKRRVPATWALVNPIESPIASRLACSVRHEPALLVDTDRLEKGVTRAEMAAAVIHPIQAAARVGLGVTTLAAANDWQPQHVDLLAKYGISIVRTPRPLGLRSRMISRHRGDGVHTLSSGMWHVPVTAVVRGGGWIANLAQFARARRAIDRTVARGGYCHLRIDVAGLAGGDIPTSLRSIERLLRHVEALHAAGGLALETLRGTAERLMPRRGASAQSILRAA